MTNKVFLRVLALSALAAACVFFISSGIGNVGEEQATRSLGKKSKSKSNVVMIMTDDQGFMDIGYRDSTFSTPTLDALANSGVKLEKLYAYTTCSPTRGSFLTGRYAHKIDLDDGAYLMADNRTLSLDLELLPGMLKDEGYATYGVGKWHLGAHKVAGLPINRGFDKWFGNLGGYVEFFTYLVGVSCNSNNPIAPDGLPPTWGTNCFFMNGFDVLDDDRPATELIGTGQYYTELLGEKATEQILSHDEDTPMFMYLAPTAPHSPLQVPDSYLDRCPDVVTDEDSVIDDGRKLICGMMAAVDDMVANVTKALDAKGMLEDTVFIYMSDNGGVTKVGSSNGILSGQKGTYLEGGVRVPGFISGEPISSGKAGGSSLDDMVFVTDLTATIADIAGVKSKNIDGNSILDKKMKLSKKFHRKNIPFGAGDAYLNGNNFAVVFEHGKKTYKYSHFPNSISYYVSYDSVLLDSTYLFDLTDDPSETTNLLDQCDEDIKSVWGKDRFLKGGKNKNKICKVIRAGEELLESLVEEASPSMIEKWGLFIMNEYGPTAKGCWVPSDSEYVDTDCQVTPRFFPQSAVPLPPLQV